jgi:hypothetical protein
LKRAQIADNGMPPLARAKTGFGVPTGGVVSRDWSKAMLHALVEANPARFDEQSF